MWGRLSAQTAETRCCEGILGAQNRAVESNAYPCMLVLPMITEPESRRAATRGACSAVESLGETALPPEVGYP